jgi:2-iminobutanoate/2-iminopropanoate deaminase
LIEGGRTLYIAGQLPIDPLSGAIVGEGDVDRQTEQTLDNLEAILTGAGMTFSNLVRVGVYLADPMFFSRVNAAYAKRIGPAPPARTTIGVGRFRLNVLIEIDAIAVG